MSHRRRITLGWPFVLTPDEYRSPLLRGGRSTILWAGLKADTAWTRACAERAIPICGDKFLSVMIGSTCPSSAGREIAGSVEPGTSSARNVHMNESLVHADFAKDVGDQMATRLALSGIPVDAAMDPWEVAVRYFDFKRRHIRARPRNVVRSREFDEHALSIDHQAGVRAIVEDAIAGRTLLPYFSRSWLNLELHDILFNDWQVCHMHLGGRTIEAEGLVKRTGPVLFVFPTPGTLYLIDVIEHGSAHPTTFAKGRIIQILHDNWPTLIEHGKIAEASDLSPNNDEARRLLSRKRNGPHAIMGAEVEDGTIYLLIGDGYMSNGRNAMGVDRS